MTFQRVTVRPTKNYHYNDNNEDNVLTISLILQYVHTTTDNNVTEEQYHWNYAQNNFFPTDE